MAKRKKTTRKKSPAKRRTSKKSSAAKEEKKLENEPEYMVQVNEPRLLRKDILESLREVIIFMQGYETFRKIQEEKVELFSLLKSQVKELNSLIDSKLAGYFPKGKLRGVSLPSRRQEQYEELEEAEDREDLEVVPIEHKEEKQEQEEPAERSELDELEDQLRDIESQLQRFR